MIKFDSGVRAVADFMAIAAKTAPKANGKDNLIIKIFEKTDLNSLADRMIEIGKQTHIPNIFNRDAECVRKSDCLIVIGTTCNTLNLDCGFCGADTCKEALKENITCAYNSGDLGIAIGSAVDIASRFHVDNRIMYTVGYTVKKYEILKKEVRMALGIPMSATGKNIFFDRII